MKSGNFVPETSLKTSDSDPRLQPLKLVFIKDFQFGGLLTFTESSTGLAR